MSSELHEPSSRFPMRIGTAALTVTALVIVWMASNTFTGHRQIQDIRDRHLRIEHLRDEIVHGDNYLTMSAYLAATTGDSRWERGYRELEPQLAKALQDALALAPDSGATDALRRIDVANGALVEMHNKALELSRQQRLPEAQAILLSPEYARQKQIYSDGLKVLDTLLHKAIQGLAENKDRQVRIELAVTLIAIFVLTVGWLIVVRTMKRWSQTLQHSRDLLAMQSDELAQTNQHLDLKVSERTHALEQSRQEVLDLLKQKEQRTSELVKQADVLLETSEQLRVSEERFRGAFEAAAIGMGLLGTDGRWLQVNPALCDMLGYSESELLAKDIQSVTHTPAGDPGGCQDYMACLLCGGAASCRIEKRYVHKSGRPIETRNSASLVHDWSGRPLHLVVTIEDISSRKEAERDRDRFVVQSLTPMCVVGYDGYFKDTNPAFGATFGHDRQKLLSERFLNVVHRDDVERAGAEIRRIIMGEPSREFEIRIRCVGDAYKWMAWNATSCEERQGFYAIGHDVTNRHLAEEALAESKDAVTTLLNSTAEGIYGMDLDGKCTLINAAGLRALGYDRAEEVLGKDVHPLIHHHRPDGTPLPTSACKIRQAFSAGRNEHAVDEVLWRRNGTSFPVEYWAHSIRREGQITGGVVSFLDITERLRTQAELDCFFTRSLSPLCICGFDNSFKQVNPALESLTGYSCEELLSMPLLETIHPDDRQAVTDEIQKLAAGTEARSFGLRVLCKDGSIRWTEWNATPLLDRQVFYASGNDLTNRHLAQEALADSEETLRAISESAHDAVILVDPQARIRHWNPAAVKIFGYSQEEALQRDLHELLAPAEVRSQAHQGFELFRQTGQGPVIGKVVELEALHKDGHRFPIELSIAGSFRSGQWHAVGIVRDISQRKRMQEELNRFFTHTPNLNVVAGYDGRVKRINPAVMSVVGRTEDEALAQPFLDFFHPADQERVLGEWQKLLAGETTQFFEARSSLADGSYKWFSWSATSFPDWQLVYATAQDVTERKRADEERQKFVSLVENSVDFIGLASLSGEVLYTNPAAETLFGVDSDRRRSMTKITDYFPEASLRVFGELMPILMTTGRWSGEITYQNFRTGQPIETLSSAFLVRDPESGAPVCMAVITRDITERKRNEAALAERARLAALTADVGIALTRESTTASMLQKCAEALVRHVDAAFARIWTLNDAEQVLELQASAGLYTHINGNHARIPVGQFKIGKIAETRQPHLTNSVIGDPRVHNQEWAAREGMVAFAGYPLVVEDQLIGVVALFSRHTLSETTLTSLAAIADGIAIGTQRRQIGEAQRLNVAAMEASADAIAITDRNGTLEWVNPAFTTLTGYSASEAIGQSTRILKSGKHTPEFYETMWKTICAGEMWRGELVNQRKDGVLYDEEMTITQVRDESGQIAHFVAIKQDITERKRAELERQKFVSLVENSNDFIGMAGLDGQCLYINDAGLRLIGRERENGTLNFRLEDCHPEGSIRKVREEILPSVLKDGQYVGDCQLLDHRTGQAIDVLVNGFLIRDPHTGEPVCFATVMRDITERKRAELERQKFVSLVENSNDFIGMARLDGQGLYINDAGLRLTGLHRENGNFNFRIADCHPEEWYRKMRDEMLPQVLKEGQYIGDCQLVNHETGKLTDVLMNLFLIRDPHTREPACFATVMRDITERKRIEFEHQKFVSLVENSSDFIGMAGLDGRGLYVNDAGLRLVGLQRENGTLNFSIEDCHPDAWNRKLREEILPRVLKEGQYVGDCQLLNRSTGQAIDVLMNLFLVRDLRTCEPVCFATVMRDISERKQIEKTLRESEQLMRTLAESIPNIVWMAQPDGTNTYINQKWVDYTGLRAEDSFGCGWNNSLHPDDQEAAYQLFQHSMMTGEPLENVCRIRRQDGTYRWFLVRGLPVRDESEAIVRWVGTCTDIDDQKRWVTERPDDRDAPAEQSAACAIGKHLPARAGSNSVGCGDRVNPGWAGRDSL